MNYVSSRNTTSMHSSGVSWAERVPTFSNVLQSSASMQVADTIGRVVYESALQRSWASGLASSRGGSGSSFGGGSFGGGGGSGGGW